MRADQPDSPIVAIGLPESSRSLGKTKIRSSFVSKLTDCDGENSETDSSLDYAQDCGYITANLHLELTSICREVGKMHGSMIANPHSFLLPR